MTFTTIVSTETLAKNLTDPAWVIIDCRFDLAMPEWGFSEYQSGHIPGAIYANLNKDLSSIPNETSGRHPLSDPEVFFQRCIQWGINQDSQVVVYDQAGGSYASRLWWMLKTVGHERVAVLDGGLLKWNAENRPISTGTEQVHPAENPGFEPQFNQQRWLTSKETEQFINDPAYILIDARSNDRFRGENETIDPIAGHIPGAVSRFHGLNLEEDGTFKPQEKLKQEFLTLLNNVPPEKAIVYCGSGVTSCHHLLAMEIAGLKGARLYAGSWSEWIRDPNRPRWQP
jgi:thiosulfate/3-mercaptopyruvate sulfurtransferase